MINVIKRDGREQNFDLYKIKNSIEKAAFQAKVELNNNDYDNIFTECKNIIGDDGNINVETLQDAIEKALYKTGFRKVRESYKEYRNDRTNIRDTKSSIMQTIKKMGEHTDHDNGNVGNNYSAKLLRIASESNKWQVLANMPKNLAKLFEQNDLYYHDQDSFNLTINCLHIPLKKMLKSGFNPGYGTLNSPKRISSAAALACILLQSCQNDLFGGQSFPNFDNDLSEYVDLSRKEIEKELKLTAGVLNTTINDITLEALVNINLEKEVRQAMQSVVYNLNSMASRAGSQIPFSSINLGIPQNEDAAMICKIFLEEYEKGLGKGEQCIFPNIIFRVKNGVNKNPEDKYYYLFDLACRVAAKRMNPTFMNVDSDFNLKYYNMGYIPGTMGCRTALMSNVNGEPGIEGRGNNAPTTINLPRLGLKAMQKYPNSIEDRINYFFKIYDEMIENAKNSLLYRYEVVKKLKVKDLPFVAGQHIMRGSENLSLNDSIDEILKNGTWGIGFIGLAETLTALTGANHAENESARELGENIIRHLRNKCDQFTKETSMNWSCYATPAEGLSGKFIIKDKKEFGIIKGITDKDYYTNSFHVPVGQTISIKDKINIEAPYHKMCNGGHISYIELDDYPTKDIIKDIITYSYENSNINYIGINFHIRYCKECGTYLHEEVICPTCGSNNIQGVSRITGYLSLDERFGNGKAAERKDRLDHNNKHKNIYHNAKQEIL